MSLDPLSKAIARAAADRNKTPNEAANERKLGFPRNKPDTSEIGTPVQTRVIPPSPAAWAQTHPSENKIGKAALTSFDVLATKVTQWLESRAENELLVTSPIDEKGKTNTAVNLAFSIASATNKNVLLVDLDLETPSIHRALGYDIEFGTYDLIQGDKKFREVAINPGRSGIIIIPGRSTNEKNAKVLAGSQIKKFAREARERYSDRLIVFNMPPVLKNADVLSFLPLVPNYLLVLEAGDTTHKQLEKCLHALGQGNLIGTVLNNGTEYDHA